MNKHKCIKNRIYITCDKACDECNYDGREQWCPIIMYGVCEICGKQIRELPDLIKCLKSKFKDMLIKDRDLAVSLYASLCNCVYVHKKTGWEFSISWRSAGGAIADIRDLGEEYQAFYCSGGENGVYKKSYKLIKQCGWIIKPLTLTERIDSRIERKELKKQLKQSIKENINPRMTKLFKVQLEWLKKW